MREEGKKRRTLAERGWLLLLKWVTKEIFLRIWWSFRCFLFSFYFLHRCATSNIPFSVGLIKSTGFLFHLCTKIKVKLFQIVHKQPWSPQRNVSEAQSAHMLDGLCQSMLFECVSALRGPFRLQNHDRYLFFSAQCRGLILRKRTEKQRGRKCKERRSLMLQDF